MATIISVHLVSMIHLYSKSHLTYLFLQAFNLETLKMSIHDVYWSHSWHPLNSSGSIDCVLFILKENFPHNTWQIFIKLHSEHVTFKCSEMSDICLANTGLCPSLFLHVRSLNHTQRRAMDAAIARALVQVCDVNCRTTWSPRKPKVRTTIT